MICIKEWQRNLLELKVNMNGNKLVQLSIFLIMDIIDFALSEEEIYDLFAHFKYIIPAGSVMYGLGNGKPVSLSNCFVIDSPKDSITGIFKTCSEQASLFKRRGGVGFDISTLRGNQAKVNNSAHYSTGSVSFMDLFSQVTNTIGEHNRRWCFDDFY